MSQQEIVGHCPQCGAPIYKGEQPEARVEYTCECRNKQQKQQSGDQKGFFKTGVTQVPVKTALAE